MARIVLILLTLLACAGSIRAQPDRRDRKSPELVVETGGRTATCDVLTFTPDGQYLLAAGDDKVVRLWPCGEQGLDAAGARTLRWSSWREQRGAIYAVALSPDRENRQIAIGGFGMRIGTVMVLDRATGKVLHALTDLKGNTGVIRALAFAPSGRRIAIGTEHGSVWLWDVTEDHAQRLGPVPKEKVVNRVRLVSFRDENTLLSVAEDGHVLEWDVRKPGAPPKKLFSFGVEGELYRVTLSPDGKWLAGAQNKVAATAEGLIAVRSLEGRPSRDISLDRGQFARSLAFDARSERLASGLATISRAKGFYHEGDDVLAIYDLTPQKPRRSAELRHSYRADNVAFHPDGRRLAVAGGNDHEVTLWDFTLPEKPISVIRSAGSCLWSVALAEDGRHLAFRDQRDADAPHPNQRGKGPWHVFDLKQCCWTPQGNLPLLEASRSAGGWTVKPSVHDPYLWLVVRKDGKEYPLPRDDSRIGLPRCYAFLPAQDGKPVRLAVGHYYGLSIYELTDGDPKRIRLYTGHQGEVMALAVSADQKWLVSASTDQTIAAWSLEDWPSHPELGARFANRDARLHVEAVDVGSPAWEAGLVEGDEITLLAYAGTKIEGGPKEWLQRLRQPEPGKELYFELQRDQREVKTLTTVRQRPLWRFFLTRDREWVLWMWQNYYYDTSTNGDSLIGWHVNNRDPDREPTFYRAEQFRKHYHRPDVIDQLLGTRKVAKALPKDSVLPPDFELLEPPAVRIELIAKEVIGEEVKLTLIATPRSDNPDHQPQQVDFWINDFRFRTWQAEGQPFRREVAVPRKVLRAGSNELTLQTYNRLGGRAEVSTTIVHRQAAEKPRVFGLFVGINDYSKSIPAPDGKRFLGNLKSARRDAEVMQQSWLRQKDRMYQEASIALTVDRDVSRATLLKELRALAERVRPDDRVVLYLSGHGDLQQKGDNSAFVFCCPDYDRKRYGETGLTSQDLYEALAALPCRKIVFLDACRSGDVAINPVRSLTPGGKGPIILAACDRSQPSYEHEKFGHGLFTYAILEALDKSFLQADRNGDGQLDAAEIFAYVQGRVPELLKDIDREDGQHPICFPRIPELYPLVQR